MDTTTLIDPDPPAQEDQRPRWRRRALIALVLLLLLGLVARLGAGASASDPDGASTDLPTGEDERREAELDDADDSTGLVAGELSTGNADGTSGGAAELEPTGDGPSSDPCDARPADSGVLLVSPDPAVLPSGQLTSSLHVRNCGVAAIDWTAATKPSVVLAAASGSLDPGEVTDLGFAIDHDAWEPGAIDFKIKVSEPGHNHYVDVHAFRPAVGSDFVASNELSAGPHAGGCADQCITKAALSTGYGSPDVGLAVETTVPAKVRVYLSTQAPSEDPAGNPVFPGVPAKATSPAGVQSWDASLTGLQPATKYFIIVKATDAKDDTAYRSGSFTTITPPQIDDQMVNPGPEPGCSQHCITKALVTPGAALDPAHLSVATHTPARIRVALSTDAPAYDGEVPSFADEDVVADTGPGYGETWEVDLDVEPGTTYHAIVSATDANGHTAHRVGTFSTEGIDVRITLQQIHVTHDGDPLKVDRGELSFAWGVGEDTVGIRSEQKMHAGTNVDFDEFGTYLYHDAKGALPTVYAVAYERDPDGLVEFCSGGDGATAAPGSNKKCDSRWNVADSGILLVDGIEGMDDCASLGLEGAAADLPCVLLVSQELGDQHPRFTAIVSYEVLR